MTSTFVAKKFRSGARIHIGMAGTATTRCNGASARVFVVGTRERPICVARKNLCSCCVSANPTTEYLESVGIILTD